MKKLFNSRFLIILASSLVVLIGLIIGAFYLFDDVDDSFVKSGYVLNPLASTSEKYFFDENVGYKENLSSMIEFKDVDDKKVSVVRDSFVHYNDESLSFLKKGAILDLDSLKGSGTVSFYNITDESIVEKKGTGYIIESASGDISLNNFIGRISDNKYIVVGNLNLKMAGNATSVKGDYFEVVYVEEGIVNIENKDVKYQVAAAGTQILVGNNKVIDLGDKKITVDDIDVMSITAITIDGDENIEIIPKAEDEEDEEGTGNEEDGTGNENVPGNNDVGGDGTGGTGNDSVDGEIINELVVSLKDADIGSTSIDVTFDILNASEEDSFKLQVVNLASGRTIDMVAQVLADVEIQVNLLSPNTKYLFMVINEKDNNKYFQKVFETTSFGIKLEKAYATDNSLVFKVTVDEGTDITNAKLSLYKFNEETMQNEIVKTGYTDSITGEVVYEDKVYNLSDFGDKLEGEHEITFDGLDNNTIYTAVLDEFSLESSNFKDIYNVTVTAMTLKRTPSFSEMTVDKNVGAGTFELSLGSITDPDNAIVSYTYMIYDMFDNALAIDPIVHTNASPLLVEIGNEDNELKNDINYYYKVVIEYYDNEKYIEYVTSDSIIFNMGSEPYITVVPDENLISYNQLGGTIHLTDNSCLITMPGRKCAGTSSSRLIISRTDFSDSDGGVIVYNELIDWEVNGDDIKASFLVPDLDAGTTYRIDVRDVLNDSVTGEPTNILHTDESKRLLSTKAFTTFTANWERESGKQERPIVAGMQLVATSDSGTMTPEETAAAIEELVIKLYDGRKSAYDPSLKLDIATKRFYNNDSFNIKEEFYDEMYHITSDGTFGLSAEALINRSSGKELNKYYTFVVEAYTAGGKKLQLIDDVWEYRVSQSLFVDAKAELTPPRPISNKSAGIDGGKLYPNLGDLTTVGFEVSFYYERSALVDTDEPAIPKEINYYVYDMFGNKIDFFVMEDDGSLKQVDVFTVDISKNTENNHTINLYMSEQATPYGVSDTLFSRGNEYYVGFEMELQAVDKSTSLYPVSGDGDFSPSGYGLYAPVSTKKQEPNLTAYIASSTANSVTYKYILKDPDNAVYKEDESENWGFYYTINNSTTEKKLDMVKVDGDLPYNQFEGSVTIPNLSKGYLYSLYYKRNLEKKRSFEESVLPFKNVGGSTETRLFEGYYNVESSSDYNFNYQIINNPVTDNKVRIKILADTSLFERMLGFEVKFTSQDSSVEPIEKKLWKLTPCNSIDKESRCLSVDYSELKAMKSNGNEYNLISVSVTALYDNGLMGYDLAQGVAKGESEYPYLILQRIKQDASAPEGLINYLSYDTKGNITEWDDGDALSFPKGYYNYKLKGDNTNIIYYSKHLEKVSAKSITLSFGYDGHYSDKFNGTIIPKMVSSDTMGCYSNKNDGNPCNTFYFTSITPSVKTSTKTHMINGAVVNLELDGTVVNDIKKDSDGSRYLYIDVWDKKNYAEANNNNPDKKDIVYIDGVEYSKFDLTVRPTVKVKIGTEDNVVNETIYEATIDGLKEYTKTTGTYYYNVYAYMNKDGKYVYTQLYNSIEGTNEIEQSVKTYELKSMMASELFKSFDVAIDRGTSNYDVRNLKSIVSLNQYKGKAYNFDLVYVLCEQSDYEGSVCGTSKDGKKNIFERVIPVSELGTSNEFKDDILSYDIEYGKDYAMLYYVRVGYYDTTNNKELITRDVWINISRPPIFTINSLSAPSFNVTKEAVLINDIYAIDFEITVNDNDKTLVGGKYSVKLMNSDGTVVGSLVLEDEDGSSYELSDYENYVFDGTLAENRLDKKIRITGLDANTSYDFVVYGDAYLNNYGVSYNDEDGDYELPNGLVVSKKKILAVKTEPAIPASTTNEYGVAFGRPSFGAEKADTVIVKFLGGSSFDNVLEVHYQVSHWQDKDKLYSQKGSYIKGENLQFSRYASSDEWYLELTGLDLEENDTYDVVVDFVIKDNPNWIRFTGEATYYKK